MAKSGESAVQATPGKFGFTVEEAAAAFAEHLPEAIQAFLTDMELQEGVPKHVFLLSYVIRHQELGELSFRMGDHGLPMGAGMDTAASPKAAPPKEYQCEWCDKPFVPTAIGQRFCADPDDSEDRIACGKQASDAKRKADLEAKGDRRYTAPRQRVPCVRRCRVEDHTFTRRVPGVVPDDAPWLSLFPNEARCQCGRYTWGEMNAALIETEMLERMVR